MENISCVSPNPRALAGGPGAGFLLAREERELDFSARKVHRRAAAMRYKTRGISGSRNGE